MTARRPLITADSVGGVWHYAVDLCRELSKAGADPVLAHLGPEPDAGQRAMALALDRVTLIETGLPLDWLCDDAGPVLDAGRTIAALARREHADLLHLDMPTLGASKDFDGPVIAVSHGCVATWWAAARDVPLAPAYRWHEALMRRGYAAADLVVAPTAAYGRTVAAHYGLRVAPATVHNGRHAPGAAHGAEPGRPGVNEDFALTVGRLWDPVKNVATLDRTAAMLTVPFYAAGAATGPHGETAEPRELHCLGQLDEGELGNWLARRPVFVSAARFEPFGLAVLEAAASGCALVLSDIDSFRELWSGAAIFVPADNAYGFARAIGRLIGDVALRVKMGDAARLRARRYSPAATAAAMAAIYAAALTARKAAA